MDEDYKLPKQKPFDALRWYSNGGFLGQYSISPVSFEFTAVTGNVVSFLQFYLQYWVETTSCKTGFIL